MNIGRIGIIASLMVIVGASVSAFAEISTVPLCCGCPREIEISFERVLAVCVLVAPLLPARLYTCNHEEGMQTDSGRSLSPQILRVGPNLQTTSSQ